MAQQIQFIYLTQSDYDSLNPKNTGRIYFTSDTHRIYKGSDLYAATTFDQLNFSAISASSITVDGNAVSLEGHTHTMSDIDDYEDNTFWITGSVNVQTFEIQVDQSFSDVVEAADARKHIRAKFIYLSTGTDVNYVCPWANVIYNSNGTTDAFDFHIMLDSNVLNPDHNNHPYLITINWNSTGFTVRPYELSETNHEHPELSGLTSSSITKDTGTFTNLVVTNASLDATSIIASGVEVNGGIQASTVSASSATFQSLTVTGEVTMSLSSVDFQNINASSLTVNGSAVSLEGHSHSASEISGLDAVISAATSGFATSKHTHDISDIRSLATKVSGLTSSKVEKTNGVFTNLSTTNLVVSSATIDAISIEASSMTVDGTGTFNSVSASSATFGDINVTGTASLSTTNVTASTLTAGAGSFTTLTVGGSNVALEGHGHSVADITDFDQTGVFLVNGTYDGVNVSISESLSDALAAAQSNRPILLKLSIGADKYVFLWASVRTDSNGQPYDLYFYLTLNIGSVLADTGPVLCQIHWYGNNNVTDCDAVLFELETVGHDHWISNIVGLEAILSGISESSIEKDTVTADIGNFRLLSVSGSANFAVNTVSANAVTVNGTEVALSGHTHSVADIDGLSTALGGFASSGHTHGELTGLTQTSISKANANFTTLSASAGTFNTLTTTDLNITSLAISSATVSSMTVTNLNVTNSLKLNNKDIATQEYVQAMISQAIGQILASAY